VAVCLDGGAVSGDENGNVTLDEATESAIYDQPRNLLTETVFPSHFEQAIIHDTDSGSSSTLNQETPYRALEPSTRDTPPAPAVYEALTTPVYDNVNSAASETANGTNGHVFPSNFEQAIIHETDSGLSSRFNQETPYLALEPSTRDLPPAPAVYEPLTTPVYVNVNSAASERANGTNGHEPQAMSGSSFRQSSNRETTSC